MSNVVFQLTVVFHRGGEQQLPRFFQKLMSWTVASTGVDDAKPRDDGAHEIAGARTVYKSELGFDSRGGYERVVTYAERCPPMNPDNDTI